MMTFGIAHMNLELKFGVAMPLIFLLLVEGSAASCSGEWVDLESPSSACVTTGRNAVPHRLVFSDEFDLDDRSFADGADSRWTAVDTSPGGNAQVNAYNASLPRTHGGRLLLPVIKKTSQVNNVTKYFQTGHVQGWCVS